jgi:hypothetical protein
MGYPELCWKTCKAFAKIFNYDERKGYWVAFISENYHQELEVYIAGNANGLNPILEKAAIRTVKNMSVVESRVKTYLAQTESTIFRPNGTILGVNPYVRLYGSIRYNK